MADWSRQTASNGPSSDMQWPANYRKKGSGKKADKCRRKQGPSGVCMRADAKLVVLIANWWSSGEAAWSGWLQPPPRPLKALFVLTFQQGASSKHIALCHPFCKPPDSRGSILVLILQKSSPAVVLIKGADLIKENHTEVHRIDYSCWKMGCGSFTHLPL